MGRRKNLSLADRVPVNTKSKLEADVIERIREMRYKARTDLVWFCNNVLGMTKVSREVHGPLIDKVLQKFPLPPREMWEKLDQPYISNGRLVWQYQPYIPLEELIGPRRTLCLDPRGWYKTSVGIIAHSIQWSLNYPDIALALIQGSQPKARANLNEIRQHYQINSDFRHLFPEHCPEEGKEGDFGNADQIITLARSSHIRREATFTSLAIETKSAGMHYDGLKFTDVVEEENVQTSTMREYIWNMIHSFSFLLRQPILNYWMHVEGTIYHEDDAHMRFIKQHMEAREKSHLTIFYRGCSKRVRPDGLPLKYEPEEMYFEKAIGPDGLPVSNFPKLFPPKELVRLKSTMLPRTYACQMELSPHDYEDSTKPFNTKHMRFFNMKDLSHMISAGNIIGYKLTIDTAEEKHTDSKYSVLTTSAWSKGGYAYILEVKRERWSADELIDEIFKTYRTWKHYKVIIEETPYVKGLMSGIRARQASEPSKHPMLPLELTPRSTRVTKDERIKAGLQPFWIRGRLLFLEDMINLDAIKNELNTFPNGQYKDILDTLSDQFLDATFIENDSPINPGEFDHSNLTVVLTDKERAKQERAFFGTQTMEELTLMTDDSSTYSVISPFYDY